MLSLPMTHCILQILTTGFQKLLLVNTSCSRLKFTTLKLRQGLRSTRQLQSLVYVTQSHILDTFRFSLSCHPHAWCTQSHPDCFFYHHVTFCNFKTWPLLDSGTKSTVLGADARCIPGWIGQNCVLATSGRRGTGCFAHGPTGPLWPPLERR
jgi:hypothetical protein